MAQSVLASSVTTPATAAVCPYLLASDGRWRASTPTREHRCTVVSPPAILAADKQRRLCLTAEHLGCSTYLAALDPTVSGADPSASRDHVRAGRAVTRTAPLLLDHGRPAMGLAALRADRGAGQNGMVALMAVAFVAIVVARLSAGGPDLTPAQVGVVASASPSASTARPDAATPAASEGLAPTLVPTEVEPTLAPEASTAPPPEASATPSPEASAAAPPSEGPATYAVRSGDTLGGIAREFGTTVKALMELNGIEDARRLRVGQVLQLR
jgi:LysM repeat protein